MPTRSKTITAKAAKFGTYLVQTADEASAHPGAACVQVSVPTDDPDARISVTVWLETADRDGEGVLTGTFTAAAPFTAAQVTNFKNAIGAIYNRALALDGYA